MEEKDEGAMENVSYGQQGIGTDPGIQRMPRYRKAAKGLIQGPYPKQAGVRNPLWMDFKQLKVKFKRKYAWERVKGSQQG